MATYYVRPGGTGSGTGPAIGQAWGTFQAPFTSGSGVTGGDTVYIAPGHYNEKVTVTITSPTSTVSIIGDVSASQFTGVSAGIVRLSGFSSAGNAAVTLTAPQLSGTSKDFLSFSNIIFEGSPTGGTGSNLVRFMTSKNISFTKCLFVNDVFSTSNAEASLLYMTAPAASAGNYTFSKCSFVLSGRIPIIIGGNNVSDTTSFKDCLITGGNAEGTYLSAIQVSVRNCTFTGNSSANGTLMFGSGSATFPSTVQNCLFLNCGVGISGSTTTVTEDYNRFVSCNVNRSGVNVGTNSRSIGASRLDYGYSRMVGLSPIDFYGPQQSSPNEGFGSASGAEATDVMSIAWTGATPDAGYQTYSVPSITPAYLPTERNAGVITITPGSTSQSIELYLGVTGLTSSSAGLSARYNRTRTASVNIPLVARTIAQAWTSGGFAEVDATNMPGVYRLDLPDAALAAGADDVTIVVRGASGTNGAVMTVKLTEEPTNAALVRMGPYEVKADGLGASDPLDIQKGAQHGVDIQCVDAFGSGIDITSATVTAKVYNSGATLVDTYACTATYAADGRATFTIDTTVTNTPGTYTATITRTTGASDTQVFGPLRIYVRDI